MSSSVLNSNANLNLLNLIFVTVILGKSFVFHSLFKTKADWNISSATLTTTHTSKECFINVLLFVYIVAKVLYGAGEMLLWLVA